MKSYIRNIGVEQRDLTLYNERTSATLKTCFDGQVLSKIGKSVLFCLSYRSCHSNSLLRNLVYLCFVSALAIDIELYDV